MSSTADRSPQQRVEVGILGATGMVGQQFIRQLATHPWFKPAWLAASDRSEGKSYEKAASWRLDIPIPDEVRGMTVNACTPGKGPRIVFSALDASVATELEPAFAAAGHIVISNTRTARMDPAVPLVIPEVNPDHLGIIPRQRRERGWSGALVTNPNCSTVVIALTLAPLRQFGLESVMVTTLQAVSGAGYPGVPSLDILGNVVPAISGEEEKIESETQKILGSFADDGFTAHAVVVSAQTTRVPVIDGHTCSIAVRLASRPSPDDVRAALRAFKGKPQLLDLPSAPNPPIDVSDAPDRPQPRLDLNKGNGMTVTVGRVRPCPVFGTKLFAMGHNTIRGAAGAAVLNAELMLAEGWVD